jgi:hypothetical protein
MFNQSSEWVFGTADIEPMADLAFQDVNGRHQ